MTFYYQTNNVQHRQYLNQYYPFEKQKPSNDIGFINTQSTNVGLVKCDFRTAIYTQVSSFSVLFLKENSKESECTQTIDWKAIFVLILCIWKCQTNHSWSQLFPQFTFCSKKLPSFRTEFFLLSLLTLVKTFVVGKYFDVQNNGLWDTICFEILKSENGKKINSRNLRKEEGVLWYFNEIISLIKKEKKNTEKDGVDIYQITVRVNLG